MRVKQTHKTTKVELLQKWNALNPTNNHPRKHYFVEELVRGFNQKSEQPRSAADKTIYGLPLCLAGGKNGSFLRNGSIFLKSCGSVTASRWAEGW